MIWKLIYWCSIKPLTNTNLACSGVTLSKIAMQPLPYSSPYQLPFPSNNFLLTCQSAMPPQQLRLFMPSPSWSASPSLPPYWRPGQTQPQSAAGCVSLGHGYTRQELEDLWFEPSQGSHKLHRTYCPDAFPSPTHPFLRPWHQNPQGSWILRCQSNTCNKWV